MEVRNEVGGMAKFCGQQPGGLFIGAFVAEPAHQIEQLAVVTMLVDL